MSGDSPHLQARRVAEHLETSDQVRRELLDRARRSRRESILDAVLAILYTAALVPLGAPTWAVVLGMLVIFRTRKRDP